MRRLIPLFLPLALLSLASVATAQDAQDPNVEAQNGNAVTIASPAPDPAPAPQAIPLGSGGPGFATWQFGIGYQLNGDMLFRYKPRFYTSGVNFSLVRFFNNWFAIEGQAGTTFGKTSRGTDPNNLDAKSLFLGGGPRFAYRTESHWEPWGHVLVGWEHFRFSQTGYIPEEGVTFGSNSTLGWMAGSGVDYHVNGRIAIRGEGDYLGTSFFGSQHRNFQVVAAAVFEF